MAPSLPFATAQAPAHGNVSDDCEPADIKWMEEGIAAHMSSILSLLRIDPNDPNAKETPARFARMLCREVCKGRFTKAPEMTTFPNAENIDDMHMAGPIAVRSLCSHHFCPILGQAWVAYVPGEKLLGLSKFERVIDWFASRPQMQEQLAKQIADYLDDTVKPKGVAVSIVATHTCMTWRGVKAHASSAMGSNAMRGVFRTDAAARAEFLHFVRR